MEYFNQKVDEKDTPYVVNCICEVIASGRIKVSVEITGLDIALSRMSAIEKQFQALANSVNKPDNEFQNILDARMESSSGENVSKGEINQLIDEYSQKNNLDADFVRAVVKQESGFNPKATSHCGEIGRAHV